MCPTGFSKTTSTAELEEQIEATPGAVTLALPSDDVTVSCLTAAPNKRITEELSVQAVEHDLESSMTMDLQSSPTAQTQSLRRRPRNSVQIERAKELAGVTHRGIYTILLVTLSKPLIKAMVTNVCHIMAKSIKFIFSLNPPILKNYMITFINHSYSLKKNHPQELKGVQEAKQKIKQPKKSN